jgi:hypothetical protein
MCCSADAAQAAGFVADQTRVMKWDRALIAVKPA